MGQTYTSQLIYSLLYAEPHLYSPGHTLECLQRLLKQITPYHLKPSSSANNFCCQDCFFFPRRMALLSSQACWFLHHSSQGAVIIGLQSHNLHYSLRGTRGRQLEQTQASTLCGCVSGHPCHRILCSSHLDFLKSFLSDSQ